LKKSLELYGFNNLTKSLSFNIYDVCYAPTDAAKQAYIDYIGGQYNAERLTGILRHLTEIIGAHILNLSKQDYKPQGASVSLLIADGPLEEADIDPANNRGVLPPSSVCAHLDTSHVSVHTFPESHPSRAISTFRVDIDVSTCGRVSPLAALDYLIQSFDSDIISVDFRVRGFTRDTRGKKYFLDDPIRSIQDFIAPNTLARYRTVDVNVPEANLFHTRMRLRELNLDDYLFDLTEADLASDERRAVREALEREMLEIFSGRNIFE
jgi:S-adenosylmethionine decarboxylase